MGISLETQKRIMPAELRREYGDVIGNELFFLLKIINKDDRAVSLLLEKISNLDSRERRMKLIDTVWQHHYDAIAKSLLETN